MSTLRQVDFSAGWIPSDDEVRGRKNGLLRMENLQLDATNALTLVRGTDKVNATPFDGNVHSIFSRTLDGQKYRYVGLTSGKCLRDDANGVFATTIGDNIHPAAGIKTAFAPSFNNILICHGTDKIKDSGIAQVTLGVEKPTTAVTAIAGVGDSIELTDSYALTADEGAVNSSGAHHFLANVDSTTFRFAGHRTFGAVRDMSAFGGGSFGSDTDTLTIDFRCPDTAKFVSFQVMFYFGAVDASPDTTPDLSNNYSFQWNAGVDLLLAEGVNTWSHLTCKRGDFTRAGTDNTKDWTNVAGIRIVAIFTEEVTNLGVGLTEFRGGLTHGPLTGKYKYRQINVENNGYLAKSGYGPDMDFQLELKSGYGIVTPSDPTATGDSKINEVWIFRRKEDSLGSDPLAQWLLVKVLTDDLTGQFNDLFSDAEALALNTPLNEALVSVQDMTFFDDVSQIIPNYFERTLYMTPREIFLSDLQDPDAIDIRYTIKFSADVAEFNLWMIKAGPSTLWVGTTNDIYEISGELQLLPDGTLNITIRPLGVKQPPVSDAVFLYKNSVFYIGTDGLNRFTGAVNESFNGALDLLWNKDDRHGQLAFFKSATNEKNFYITAAKGKLFVSVTMRDTSRTCVVYDFRREYWYVYKLKTGPLFTEEDDTLLAGFADGTDYFLRIIDFGTTTDFDEAGFPVFLRTPFFDDGAPFNRKDPTTLKIKLDSGDATVNVRLWTSDLDFFVDIGTCSPDGMTENQFDLSEIIGGVGSSVPIPKNFMLELQCDATNVFRLTEWGIEYTARPTQQLSLRLEPTDYGVAGRKRIPAIPMIIDTIGAHVTFTPMLDGQDQTPSDIYTNTSGGGIYIKDVINHYFTSDKKARIIGGRLQGTSPFEFYELVKPRIIEVLPDPARFFVIPNTNLGTQCRKRIIAIAFIIDTQSGDVTFTPVIDGVDGTPSTVNTSFKQTVIHYFTTNVEGTDISGRLEGASFFEYYEWDLQECISEKMPVPAKRLRIPQEDYGTPARKRHSSYKFRINTRGSNVVFTPRIDETDYPTATYNTSEPQVVEYFFSSDTIGINIGGLLTGANPFEYYGSLKPEIIEKLPDRLKFYVIPETNFGVAAKKRIRTIPLVINTNGSDVVFTPIVDGVGQTPATFNTSYRKTVLYYFEDDSFGIDYKGTLLGTNPFEFYQMLKPEDVQVIPVGKKLDQLGPIEFLKLGKVLGFRLRVIAEGTSIAYTMYDSDTQIGVPGTITTTANKDKVYEVSLPKGINCEVLRVVLSSADPFHRFYGRFKVNLSGGETESKWILFGADPDVKAH